jgi:trigger factor
MKVQVVDLSSYERQVDIELPPDNVRHGFDHVFRSLKGKVRIPGFRKGKVPRGVLLKRFKGQVEGEVIEHLIEESFGSALARHGLVPVNQPIVDQGELSEGIPFRYSLRFEVMPKVDIKDYAGVTIPKIEAAIGDEAVEEELEARREKAASLQAIDRPAAIGDVVTFDYDGSVDGEELEGGGRTGLVARLGQNQVLDVFEKALEGAKTGDVVDVNDTLPESHPNAEVAGKAVAFKVTVKDVQERVLADLDDDFAADHDFDSLDDMRAKIRGEIEINAEREAKEAREKALIEAVLEKNEFEIPPSMVRARTDASLQQGVQALANAGIDVSRLVDLEKMRGDVRERVIFDVRKQVILEAISRKEGYEITDGDVDAKIEEIARDSDQPVPKVRANYAQGEGRAHLEQALMTERVLDFLLSGANVAEGSSK